jgi:thiol-disulfide isomerase/thioredoxin
MRNSALVSAMFDILAGVAAIAIVVGSWFWWSRIALDSHALYVLAGMAFLVAGAVRGSGEEQLSVVRIAMVCSPVLLGMAVLIMYERHHELVTPMGLMVVAIMTTACGLSARGWWYYDPRVAAGIAGGALAAVLVVPVLFSVASGSFQPRVRTVDAFVLSTSDRTIPSTSLQGRVVVLAFWASWCGPCKEELPEVERAYERYRSDERVAFYAVDVGGNGESAEDGERSYMDSRLEMPLAFDSGEVSKQFDIDAIPTLVLIDAQGRERFVHRGWSESEDLEAGLAKHVEQLLEEER